MAQAIRCRSYKADGALCGIMTRGGPRCGRHENQYLKYLERYGPLRENQCEKIRGPRIGRCQTDKIEGSCVCQFHFDEFARMREERERQRQAALERANQRREVERLVEAAVDEMWARNPRPTWQQVTREYFNEYFGAVENQQHLGIIGLAIARRYAARQIVVWPPRLIEDYWEWLEDGQQGPEPQAQPLPQFNVPPPQAVRRAAPAVPRLQALARDTQNVHTREVSEQTNGATEKLLKFYDNNCTTKKFRSPDWLAAKWLPERYGSWNVVANVVDDMQRWYNTKTCRVNNDFLYRKCLDALYQMIKQVKDDETRKELFKRAFEECSEAVGMCCEGHVSRLCNVMVGFDDNFKPPVPIGELLQNAMAKIAQSDVDANDKVAEAMKVFNELNVAEAERVVWLEALEGF